MDAGAGGDRGGVSTARSPNVLRLAFAFAFAADRRHEAKCRVVRALLAQVEILWRRMRVIMRAVKAWKKNAVEAFLQCDMRRVLLRAQDVIK